MVTVHLNVSLPQPSLQRQGAGNTSLTLELYLCPHGVKTLSVS